MLEQREITWGVQTHRDTERLLWCVGQVRAHFPDSRVVIRADGSWDPFLPTLAERFGAELHLGHHLYRCATVRQNMAEMLDLYLKNPTPYLFLIDTDTQVCRPFRGRPPQGLCGTVQVLDYPSAQGGCTGMDLETVRVIVASGLLQSTADPRDTFVKHPVLRRYFEAGGPCNDWLMGWCCSQLGIPVSDFPEVRSEWRTLIDNDDLRYAVIHPVKRIPLDGVDAAWRYWRKAGEDGTEADAAGGAQAPECGEFQAPS